MTSPSGINYGSPLPCRADRRTWLLGRGSTFFTFALFALVGLSGIFVSQVSGLRCDIIRPYSNGHFSLFASNPLGYITDSHFDPGQLWFVQPLLAGYVGDDLSHYSTISNATVVEEGIGSKMFTALRMNETSSIASFRAEHLAGNWSRPFTILQRFRLSSEYVDQNTTIISQQRYSSSRPLVSDSGFALISSGNLDAVIVFYGDLLSGTFLIARSLEPVFVPGLWHDVAVSVNVTRNPFARLIVDGVEVPLNIRTSLEHVSDLVSDTSTSELLIFGSWALHSGCTHQMSDIGDLIVCDDDLPAERLACMHEYYFGISEGVSLFSEGSGSTSAVECTESIPSKSSSATPSPTTSITSSGTVSSTPSITSTATSTGSSSVSVTVSPTTTISASRSPSASGTPTTSPTISVSASSSESIVYYSSCLEILLAGSSTGDHNNYYIVGDGGLYRVACDMTNGGWTRVVNVVHTSRYHSGTTGSFNLRNLWNPTNAAKFSDSFINSIITGNKFWFQCGTCVSDYIKNSANTWTSNPTLADTFTWSADANRDGLYECNANRDGYIFSDHPCAGISHTNYAALSDVEGFGCYAGACGGWQQDGSLWVQ